ncbi:MAG: DinB family protein [Flavobacteriaceae bacterium]
MIFQAANFNRISLLKILENLTPEELCFIPKGFKNNILWNLVHILVTEQLLTYKLSGLPLNIDENFVRLFGKGSLPLTTITQEEIKEIKDKLITANKQTKIDYDKGLFKNFHPYKTSTGIVLKNVDDALQFNAFHEGIHFGIILSIKKLL